MGGTEPDRLYPSVYLDDDEAYEIWNRQIISSDRIYRFEKKITSGNMELVRAVPARVYYDRGKDYGCGSRTVQSAVTAIDIWNLE